MATISNSTVAAIEALTGYHFRNIDHLWLALQAAGSPVFRIGGRRVGSDGNKRLAVVGDSVISLMICTRWFCDVEMLDRAEQNALISRIASNANLNNIGQILNLGRYINRNPSAVGVRVAPATMASTVEAIIGAVYLDSDKDLDTIEAVMLALGLE